MSRPSTSQVGQALLATLRAGAYASAPIRVTLADGSEVRPPAAVVVSPSVGFELLGEGFVVSASDWTLQLYSSNGREPSTGVELAFLDAIVAALAADPSLGGVVSGAYPLGTDEAVATGGTVDSEGNPGPPTMYRRSLRIHIDH